MTTYLPISHTFNRFLEDSSVLTALAYLLSLGPLPSLFDRTCTRRDQMLQAVVFGLIGASESLFPGDRYPYVTFTLAAAFAGYAGGLALGLLTTAVSVVVAGIAAVANIQYLYVPIYVLSVLLASLVGTGVAWIWRHWTIPLGSRWQSLAVLLSGAFVAGAGAEIAHTTLVGVIQGSLHDYGVIHLPLLNRVMTSLSSIVANGGGCLILAMVLRDSYDRMVANQRRIDAETALATLRLRQLGEIQARLHPHFLFNTLSTIAGLCTFAPDKAEAATVQLGELMRYALKGTSESEARLGNEIRHTRLYLEIEKQRYGPRLQVNWEVEAGAEEAMVPPFSIQTLVENAVSHGVGLRREPGWVTVTARRYPRHVLIAVSDNGAGMSARARRDALVARDRPHGLVILTQQLTLLSGRTARVRLFSREGVGTMAVFAVPAINFPPAAKEGDLDLRDRRPL